jgi:rhamnosyltransferase
MQAIHLETTKKCSVVIPTKNGGKLFLRLLKGLQQQSIWDQTELIVIDSGSKDGTLQAARNVGAKVIEIPPKSFNHGATRDYGISLANCDVVVLIVQDAIPNNPNLLESIVANFKDLEIAGVYVRQNPQPDADLLTKRNLNNWLTGRAEREIRKMKSLDWYEGLAPIEKYFFCNFDNVCSAIHKSAWQTYKFGEINFGEDIDWAERVLKGGLKIIYEPAVAVIHSHDRPVSYEYKRTYVCHRKLYRQFGLHLVPTIRGAVRSWIFSTRQDINYVRNEDAPIVAKLALLTRIPLLNFLSSVAQYRAVRDEVAGKTRRISGV